MKDLRLHKLMMLPVLMWIMALRPVQVHAQEPLRYLTINIHNGTLDAALQEVSTAAGIGITYNPAALKKIKVAAKSFRNMPVAKVLEELLKGTGYAFRVNGERYQVFALAKKNEPAKVPREENNPAQPTVAGFITGKVLDEKNRPLEFASVQLADGSAQQTTAADGTFQLRVPDAAAYYQLTISFVGKQTIERMVQPAAVKEQLLFVMKELSLTLDGVVVNAVQKGTQSNSSIVFDREAIEQSQAFSMADLMNRLPGKEVKAPDLHHIQNLTLRTAADDKYANNNSLGTAIIVDGIAVSNNANMQNKSIAMFGQTPVSHRGTIGVFDVPFSGLDLRDIPVNNIERIEVISGVADAQYGDITSGAVIIDRQAGKTPYQFSLGINGYSTQYSLSKGFDLGGKAGAVNFSVNHLRSIDDPRSDLQSYNRTTFSGMWTNYIAWNLKNTLSVNYAFRDDNIRQDPEDATTRKTYVKSHNIGITNRTTYRTGSSLLEEIGLNLGFSKGRQESYTQFAMNSNPQGVGDKDTTGVYEGYYIPGIYTAVDHILGQPMNGTALLNFKGRFHTGEILHQWSGGASLALAANNGLGVIADPDAPRFVNQHYQNQRPYNYEYLPAMFNTGYYVQDKVNMYLAGRLLSVTAGLRYDIQNGWGSWQPRVNAAYKLNEKWQMTLAYGIATKAPTMTYRYPAPTYFDIPLLEVYDPEPDKRVYLVYTQKYTPDNSFLKPMRASQLEWGLKHNGSFISSSVFVYFKKNRNEFNTVTEFRRFNVPVYDYRIDNGKLVYWPTDSTILRASLSQSSVTNGKQTDDIGIDWMISTKKIRAIATTFSVVTGFSYSRFETSSNRVELADNNLMSMYKTWYGIFPPLAFKRWLVTSQLNTSTHIPRLGFIFNMNASFSWIKHRENLYNSGQLEGYVNLDGSYHEIVKPDYSDPVQIGFGNKAEEAAADNDPFYMNLHLQVAKEIKKKIRFSVNAYNVFNLRFRKINPVSSAVITFTSPVVLSGELSFKF